MGDIADQNINVSVHDDATPLNTLEIDATGRAAVALKTTAGKISGKDEGSGVISVDVNLRSSTANQTVVIKSGDSANLAAVDVTGNLKVVSPPPSAPPASVAVERGVYSAISATSDDTYVITSGKTLTIQQFLAGAEYNSGGSRVELWYDPNGTGVGMTIIAVFFLNGSNARTDLSNTFVGNGTRAIRMRRLADGGGSRNVFGKWFGYEV